MTEKYKEHPIAGIFPMIGESAFERLKADIQSDGIKESGLLYEGKVLDGRNRYRAACELGIEMSWMEVELGEPDDIASFDPVAYVLSKNLHRRHLKQSQRAMIAAKMATLKNGSNQHKKEGGQNCLPSLDASKLLSVSERSVKAAKHVIEHGSNELIAAVESEVVKVSMAEKLCKACDDKREQTRLVKEGRDAIKIYLNPTPDDEGEPEANTDDEIVGDQYEYPIVKMFKHADYRVNTLKMLVKELTLVEVEMLKEFLANECA